MSGDELRRMVGALFNPDAPLQDGQPSYPQKTKAVWVVAEGDDGTLMAVEIPQPEGIAVNTWREEREPDPDMPFWLRERFLPDLGPWKLRVEIDGYDKDKHPGEEPPEPQFVIYVREARTQ